MGGQFDTPPLVFQKIYVLEREDEALFFFFNFNIIISHIFPENFTKIPQVV